MFYDENALHVYLIIPFLKRADYIFIRTDPAGNIKPDREKSTEKTDGAVAAVMALDRAIRCGNDTNDTSESVYDSRELMNFLID